jgi:hypothetical protein
MNLSPSVDTKNRPIGVDMREFGATVLTPAFSAWRDRVDVVVDAVGGYAVEVPESPVIW